MKRNAGCGVGGELRFCRVGLVRVEAVRRVVRGWQRRRWGRLDRSSLRHGRLADGSREALEPQVLARVRVQELFPQTRRGWVRSRLADRLRVEVEEDGARRDEDLPGRDVGAMRLGQAVPRQYHRPGAPPY